MSITPVRFRVQQGIPDIGPDTVARRRLRDLERGADWAETAVDAANTVASLNPLVPTSLDLDPSVNESLEQIGDSNWYGPPAEGADPRNCDLWPNSPYCGGDVVDPLSAREVGIAGSVSVNPCETCIQIDPSFLGISGPSGIYCRRRDHPDCQPGQFSDAEEPEPNAPNPPLFINAAAPAGRLRVVFSICVFETPTGESFQTLSPNDAPDNWVLDTAWFEVSNQSGQVYSIARAWTNGYNYFPIEPQVGWAMPTVTYDYNYRSANRMGRLGGFWYHSNFPERMQSDNTTIRNWVFWQDIPCDDVTNINQAIQLSQQQLESFTDGWSELQRYRDVAVDLTPRFYTYHSRCEGLDRPTNQPLPRPDMGCCDETLELLEAVYSRLGVDEFPVKAPPLLVQEDEQEVSLENHAQLWEWTARNLDAVMGQFPIKIRVKDSDPTKEGDQEVELSLPNVAETLAELFGLVYQSEINTDLITEILLRLIPEVISTKNAALIGQSYSKANASFLGYKANAKEVPIDYNFDLEESRSLPRFLREAKKRITIHEDESPESVLDILAKVEFAAGIIKSAFYMKPSESGRLLGAIETMLQDEALSIPNKEQWRDWLQRMNRDTGRHNRGQPIQPEVIEDLHEGFDRL